MKNPNQGIGKIKKLLLERWSEEEFPGAEPAFQMKLLAKDFAIYIGIPFAAVFVYRSIETATKAPKRPMPQQQVVRDRGGIEQSKSQIIEFRSRRSFSPLASVSRRSPGSLVKIRLQNVVETYSTAPVHAQVVDAGLGQSLIGGTLLGDATPDSTFERITISFRFVKDPNRDSIAIPISARALGLDGTLGLIAMKKEGFVTRSVLGSAGAMQQDTQGKSSTSDFKDILVKALTAGLVQEFGSSTQVERNRAQVLTLKPGTEFFAELTDFFPSASK